MDIQVIEKEILDMAEVESELKKVKSKDRKPSQQRTYDVARAINYLSKADSAKLISKLKELGIVRLTDSHMIQIANFKPLTKQELESVFTATKTTIKQDDQEKILAAVKEFVK